MSVAFIAFGVAFAAVAAGTIWLVLAPLARPRPEIEPSERTAESQEMLARREAAVQALRDLDDDMAHSRITESEYRLLRERYTLEALDALKASENNASNEARS